MGLISTKLLPALQAAFPDRRLCSGKVPNQIAVIPPIHAEFGNVVIWDDGDEATVELERFTHGHFNPYDRSLTPEQVADAVTEMVISFLADLFADRVVVWGEANRSGGWLTLHGDEPAPATSAGRLQFVWSGPYKGP
jgi:hypothetical protein